VLRFWKNRGREIILERRVPAPRGVVYRAWTDPNESARWWGAKGSTTTTLEMNVRVGGVRRYSMTSPDGNQQEYRDDYIEVVDGEKLVYDHYVGNEQQPQFRGTVVLSDDGSGGTHFHMRMRFASKRERDRVVELGGIKGGNETLDRMEEHVVALREKTMSDDAE